MAGASSCTRVVAASRNYVTRQVETGSFNGISTSNSVDVVYTQSTGSPRVEIYAPDNEIDRITVETRDGILRVGIKGDNNHKVWGSAKREVRVSAPAVNSLEASSSGDIILKNSLTSNGNITISVSSSGDVIGDNISCTGNIDLSASSSGDIKAGNMKCRNLTASASSSGDVKIGTLSCDNFTAYAGSSGDVVVRMLTAQNVKANAQQQWRRETLGNMCQCRAECQQQRLHQCLGPEGKKHQQEREQLGLCSLRQLTVYLDKTNHGAVSGKWDTPWFVFLFQRLLRRFRL